MKSNNPIITLTTDMGLKDHYVGVLKGNILSSIPGVQLVDITHDIQSFNIARAAFVVKHSAFSFPKGSIHIVGVSPEVKVDPENPDDGTYPLLMSYEGHYFIASDNGFFSLLTAGDQFDSLIRVSSFSKPEYIQQPLNTIMVEMAKDIISGKKPEKIGEPVQTFKQAMQFAPAISENLIRGSVIHIDKYGNIITNIHQSDFDRVGKGHPFVIYFRKKEYYIDQLSKYYGDVEPGEKLAFFNFSGHLEIAINQGTNDTRGGADTLFGVHLQDIIRVEFFPNGSKENFDTFF